MDREKRRSKEDEEELDRKIALIREKNLKIEQRSKEVEADRVQNADSTPKKPSQTPHTQPAKTTGKNKAWDREWDQGKTPVETWRENVPSIEHTGRLASAQNPKQRNRQQKPSDVINRGGRLEGRLSVMTETPAKGRGSGEQRDNKRAVHQNKSGDLTVNVKVKNSEGQPSGRGERQGKRNRGNSEKKAQDPAKEGAKNETNGNEEIKDTGKKNNKSRPRRENDKHIVKVTLMRVLDRVDKMERKRMREEQREKQEEEQTETKTEEPEQPGEEKKDDVKEKVAEAAKSQEEPQNQSEHVKTTEEEKSDEKASDANQNVITLTKERVLSVQMTS